MNYNLIGRIKNWLGVCKVKKRVNKPACTVEKQVGACAGQLGVNGPSHVLSKACKKKLQNTSLIPRPPPFFVLRFAFSIIHGSGRARKTGKAWEHLSRDDVWWTRGGRRGGGVHVQITY